MQTILKLEKTKKRYLIDASDVLAGRKFELLL
jgi:hypothetical protein